MKDSNVITGSCSPSSTSSSLLAKCRVKEHDAWARLARLYGPLVYAWCRRRGLREEDAADVVQDVFRAVFVNIGAFVRSPDGTFRGWLWTITRTKLMDHFRRNHGRPAAVGGSDAQMRLADIPESLEQSETGASATANLVRRALEIIRPDFEEKSWQAFWRVMMEGQSPADVARDLGLTVNAVYISKSRVLRRLRDELGGEFT